MLSKPTTLFHCFKGILVAQRVRFVLLTLVVLLAVNGVRHNAGVAHAGAIAPSCEELIVFDGANVNNYVKQFAGVTDPDLPLDEAGKMLALLIQLDGLYSQIGYGPLGYVYIKTADGNPEECLNELIIKRILGKACCSRGELRKGRSAILLSGHFQRVKDQIYLLTSVEFFRNGIDEIVSIPSRVAGGKKISFVANLADTAVSFAPRKFTKKQLDRVAHDYSDAMDVRAEPDVNLQAQKIAPFAIDGFSYYIEEKRSDDWLKIKSFKPGLPSGWVRVPDDIGGRGLRDLLPELYFMDATALYLQTRIGRNNYGFSPERYKRHLLKFKSLEGEFAKRVQGAGDRRALGLLKSMHAVLMIERKGADINAEEMMRISELAAEAAELLPTSSAAHSLAELTWFAAEQQRDGKSFSSNASALEKNLLQVLSTDPANVHVKASLEMLWRLRLSYDENNWWTSKLDVLRKRFLKNENVQRLIYNLTAPSGFKIHPRD